MAVMAREAWTDGRLDDLAKRMDKGFDEVKGEVRDLREETKAEFRELRGEMNSRFNSVDARFDALQRTMVLSVVGMSASIVGALLATQL
jgi:hypothetical protein